MKVRLSFYSPLGLFLGWRGLLWIKCEYYPLLWMPMLETWLWSQHWYCSWGTHWTRYTNFVNTTIWFAMGNYPKFNFSGPMLVWIVQLHVGWWLLRWLYKFWGLWMGWWRLLRQKCFHHFLCWMQVLGPWGSSINLQIQIDFPLTKWSHCF